MRFNLKGGAPSPGNKNHECKVFVDFWQKNVRNSRNQGKLTYFHLTNIQTCLGWTFKAILGKNLFNPESRNSLTGYVT